MTAVLSIQSHVAYGHVGNAAAAFALQRLGHDVWAVPTVLYSNQPGHGGKRGRAVPAAWLADMVTGVAERGWLQGCGAVLSGYLGAPQQAGVVAQAVRRVKAASPEALYLCDPAFGDLPGGIYVETELVREFREVLVPLADIATPNVFELAHLTGRPVDGPETAIAAARRLGPPLVLCTSVPMGRNEIGTLAVTPGEAWGAWAPILEHPPHGSGDLMAALFLGHILDGHSPPDALARAASAVDALLRAAVTEGLDEMPLVRMQKVLTAAPHLTASPVSL
jgi:pyridoxine kinase